MEQLPNDYFNTTGYVNIKFDSCHTYISMVTYLYIYGNESITDSLPQIPFNWTLTFYVWSIVSRPMDQLVFEAINRVTDGREREREREVSGQNPIIKINRFMPQCVCVCVLLYCLLWIVYDRVHCGQLIRWSNGQMTTNYNIKIILLSVIYIYKYICGSREPIWHLCWQVTEQLNGWRRWTKPAMWRMKRFKAIHRFVCKGNKGNTHKEERKKCNSNGEGKWLCSNWNPFKQKETNERTNGPNNNGNQIKKMQYI